MKRKVLFEAVGLVILMGLLVFVTQILLKSIPTTTSSKSPIASPLAQIDDDLSELTPVLTPESVAVAIEPSPTASVPFKPTLTPTAIPTATPIPTPLPLPEGDFYALWADSLPDVMGSTIWLADPRDIGSRQEILSLNGQTVYGLAGSPDGQHIAFTVAGGQATASPLWVMNADGSDLRELAPNAGQILWTPDSQNIIYGNVASTGNGFLEHVEVSSGIVTHLVTVTSESLLSTLLGWDNNNTDALYAVQVTTEQGRIYKLCEVDVNTHIISEIATLHEFHYPALSPDGRYLIHKYGTPDGLPVYDIHNQTTQLVPLSGQEVSWRATTPKLLTLDALGMQVTVWSHSLADIEDAKQGFVFPDAPGGIWSSLATSPDDEWFIAHHTHQGYYWLHRESGLVVSVPNEGRCRFSWLHR